MVNYQFPGIRSRFSGIYRFGEEDSQPDSLSSSWQNPLTDQFP